MCQTTNQEHCVNRWRTFFLAVSYEKVCRGGGGGGRAIANTCTTHLKIRGWSSRYIVDIMRKKASRYHMYADHTASSLLYPYK